MWAHSRWRGSYRSRLMTFWITSYVLTRGILRADELEPTEDGRYAHGNYGRHGRLFKRIGTDAFRTEAEAKARARLVIQAKLAVMDKQREKLLEKLKALTAP